MKKIKLTKEEANRVRGWLLALKNYIEVYQNAGTTKFLDIINSDREMLKEKLSKL